MLVIRFCAALWTGRRELCQVTSLSGHEQARRFKFFRERSETRWPSAQNSHLPEWGTCFVALPSILPEKVYLPEGELMVLQIPLCQPPS